MNNGLNGNSNNGMNNNYNNGLNGNSNNGMNGNSNNGMNNNYNNGMNGNSNNGMNNNYNNGMYGNYNNGMNNNYNNGIGENYIYASAFDRFFALLIDDIVLFVSVFAFVFLLGIFIDLDFIDENSKVIGIGLSLLYSIILSYMNSSTNHATIGKKAMKIQIIKKDGNYLTFFEAFIREIIKSFFASTGILGLVSILTCLFSEKHQTLHDLILGQYVVRK